MDEPLDVASITEGTTHWATWELARHTICAGCDRRTWTDKTRKCLKCARHDFEGAISE